MLFLLSCLLSFEKDDDQTTISIEQTRAVHFDNFDHGYKSSVQIHSLDEGGEPIGHGSGNYFKIGKEKFIITADHVMNHGSAFLVRDGTNVVLLTTIYRDPVQDIAIVIPERELRHIKAKDYKLNTKNDLLGISVNYTGYPSDLGKSLFRGIISSFDHRMAILQSFALPGASGSVVFDNAGRVIGVLSAVKLGVYEWSIFPQLHGSLVCIERLRFYKRKDIKEIIKKWRNDLK